MIYHIVETEGLRDYSPDGVRPTPLLNTDEIRALLLNLDTGQAVAPCRMSVPVLYYVIEGQGHLRVDQEQTELRVGSLAVVPAGAVRSISAAEPMRVLAVQVLP